MEKNFKPNWIWYPGDFEIWQHLKVSLRRRERYTIVPVIWKLDTFYPSVVFRKDFCLEKSEEVKVYIDGDFHISLDGLRLRNVKDTFIIPEGKHNLSISVANQHSIPSIFVQGETIISDNRWEVSCCGQIWHKAGHWNFDSPSNPPSVFNLPVKEVLPVHRDEVNSSIILDFGKEIYAALKLSAVSGEGSISIYYGESLEEAMSSDKCVLIDSCEVAGGNLEYVFPLSAFRYVNIKHGASITIKNISALFEYLPLEYRGSFKCSEERLNTIWDVSRYTLHLNTREFFLDGIKRDGWVWSGDAYQSYLLNYYAFFDLDVTRRTLIALRGKDPVKSHINTIMDYSFFWFLGLYDYYLYTGDLDFIRDNYPKMLTLMDFCLGRTNKNGMMEGLPGDWIFIDWADMDKTGEVSAEQLLFCRSLEIMALISELLEDREISNKFSSYAQDLRNKIMDFFWDENLGGLVTARTDEKTSIQVTKHANIFALTFKYLSDTQTKNVISNILLNDNIQKIKTPYFRFYEFTALCEAGEHAYVLNEMLNYWGGMLELGATTFWEEFDPGLNGTEHYAMYGEPFDKSLCHAWGASPIYILGRYFLGVVPLTPGYETYEIRPNLGTLSWIQGSVPAPSGEINVYMDRSVIKVKSSGHKGFLRFNSKVNPLVNYGEVNSIQKNLFEIIIDKPGYEYIVTYEPIS